MKNLIPGYDPYPFSPDIQYDTWAETMGKYRWRHEDGTPRTYYKLDYDWEPIFDIVTKEADMYFMPRLVECPDFFTSEFLARVPMAWIKFKTQLELLSGMLDGTTIDPELFEQGFDRTFKRTENVKSDVNDSSNSSATMGSRTDSTQSKDNTTTDDKARTIDYEQGVQGYDNGFGDIGGNGNQYASRMVDTLNPSKTETAGENTFQQGEQVNTGSQSGNTNGTQETGETIEEHVKRINYYDNLAFLRDRMDRLENVKPFYSYFLDLFTHVDSFSKGW